ncbi:DNA alkylation repair protein [Clostridium sp. YIM B02505]|uniref:DNA alkylation repair protein n=1 Tax=Clostridium yunnanense TaxID=2800325 RepID=A0ABS1EPD2_9CLOT|nr:DNA alkylation repair protein [Clostridium yunnanense]MBK1811138.1 DNA alkylation repair protein [Clostridium yunnanense]
MAEPLKDIYNESFLKNFGEKVKHSYLDFNIEIFVSEVLKDNWDELALKQRMRRIAESLGRCLPRSYNEALKIMFSIDEECVGFPYLFFPDFVEVFGQGEEDLDLSIKALERFTVRSSSEFAVRHFLIKYPERMISQMKIWAKSDNEHIRRLASEGCRPRLPWGIALSMFKKDPTSVLSILEILKKDSSLYVRKSVANNLNDISKDNPTLVIETVKRWKNDNSNTDWIIRHGCRTLIKKAVPEVMELFGYTKVNDEQELVESSSIIIEPKTVTIGETSELTYSINIKEGQNAKVRIEYSIDFVKSRGKVSSKAFLITDKVVAGGVIIRGTKKHSWADLTTRRHYPGKHKISLLVNGVEVAETEIIVL